MELQCNSFKIIMIASNYQNKFSGRNEFSSKQALRFISLTLLPVFQSYCGKQMVFKQAVGMTTQNML